MVVEIDEGPGKLGKFPDFITKGLNKPGFISSKIKGAYQLGKILYKAGAIRKVGRYYAYRHRYKIATGIAASYFASSFLQSPSQNGQTRDIVVKSRPRRRSRNKYCPPDRRTGRR